jgi:hypothetical protein
MAKKNPQRPYYRPQSPGMGHASPGPYCGEHPAGLYTPPDPEPGGAAGNLVPHDPYGDAQGTGERPRGRLPKSISNRY